MKSIIDLFPPIASSRQVHFLILTCRPILSFSRTLVKALTGQQPRNEKELSTSLHYPPLSFLLSYSLAGSCDQLRTRCSLAHTSHCAHLPAKSICLCPSFVRIILLFILCYDFLTSSSSLGKRSYYCCHHSLPLRSLFDSPLAALCLTIFYQKA